MIAIAGCCGASEQAAQVTPTSAAKPASQSEARVPASAKKGHARPDSKPAVARKHHETAAPEGHSVHGEHARQRLGADHAGHHGEHAHPGSHRRFKDASRWAAIFESKKRDAWQKGDALVASLKLPTDARVADIGSATGYFAVRFARKVPKGDVWAVDIEPDMVRFLARRARKEGLSNLHSVLGEAADPLLTVPMDVIFVCNTYHHIQGRSAYFKALAPWLRKGGRIVIVDFKMGDIPVGPPPGHRVPPEVIVTELTRAGYGLKRRDDRLLPYQHVLVFQRAP